MNRSCLRTAITTACVLAASSTTAQVTLFEGDNFYGRTFDAAYSVSNLSDTGFNDRAASLIVRRGQWQLCEDAYFRGRCETFGPGEYPSLGTMGFRNKISSVRQLGWTPDGAGGWGNDTQRWGGGDRWGSGNRAILFSGSELTGQAFAVSPAGLANLDRTGFNDKARSLRIESGYWIFCTDANYQGDCHTYGPGDYPTLPSGQNHAISSGRRVSGNYPYRSNPNWGGY